jgi:hypothetical protein
VTVEQAVARLDDLTPGDQEIAHQVADDILTEMVPKSVADAYERCRERVGFWYS